MTSEAQKRAYPNWIKAHPDKYKENYQNQNKKMREKLNADPELLEQSKARQHKNYEDRKKTDPEFVELKREQSRAYYWSHLEARRKYGREYQRARRKRIKEALNAS
jgi:hypothetical protein